MLKMRMRESTAPKQNIELLAACAPHVIGFGKLLMFATMLPLSQSYTRISFLPAPPQNSRSY